MHTVRDTILFVLLPVATIITLAAVGYHSYAYPRAQQEANEVLTANAELAAEWIQQDIRNFQQSLQAITVQGRIEEYVALKQYELFDEAEDARLDLEAALFRLATVNVHVKQVEFYELSGERFVSITEQRRDLSPRSARQAAWFQSAVRDNSFVGFDKAGDLRFAELFSSNEDEQQLPVAVGTIVFDFAVAAKNAAERSQNLNSMEFLVQEDKRLLFKQGDLSKEKNAPLEAKADVDPTKATITIRQAEPAALSSFYTARISLWLVLTGLTLGILSVTAVGTRRVVKDLSQVNRRLNRAQIKLQQHASALEKTHASMQRQSTQLVHTNRALEVSNSELQQFAYVASHDLQTPLRGIAGFAQLLQEDYVNDLDEAANDYLQRIIRSATRMQDMIDDLLDLSRLESRAQPFEPVDLNEVMEEVISSHTFMIQELAAEVHCEELPTVSGDRTQLTQLFQNLLSNALKYHGEQAPVIDIKAEIKDHDWIVSVQDNGIGMESQYVERIFNIFERLHSGQKYAGTGIGLAICWKIAQRHAGSIWCRSTPDRGSTFFVRIPMNPPGETPEADLNPAKSSIEFSGAPDSLQTSHQDSSPLESN